MNTAKKWQQIHAKRMELIERCDSLIKDSDTLRNQIIADSKLFDLSWFTRIITWFRNLW